MGDIIDWNEQKMFAKANAHGAVVAKNIIAQVNGSNPTAEYKGFMEAIVLSVGPVRESLLLPAELISEFPSTLYSTRTEADSICRCSGESRSETGCRNHSRPQTSSFPRDANG